MQKWEVALEKFLDKWKKKKEVVGAIVCGSYITGSPSKHSDIDIHFILKKGTKWRERGNEIIDGVLMEYFANPAISHKKYAEGDLKNRRKINSHMFATGKICFDKTGELKKLVKEAKKDMRKKYPKIGKIKIELAKYHLWDMQDNLEEVFESGEQDFLFVYYTQLEKIFEHYSEFLRFDKISANKLRRFLTNQKDKEKYFIEDFPDQKFVELFVNSLKSEEENKMLMKYQELTKHVLKKMGGFNIDGWKMRSPVK